MNVYLKGAGEMRRHNGRMKAKKGMWKRTVIRKRYLFLCMIILCAMMCSGCSVTQKYYSKRKVKKFTKDLVANDVKYIKNEKVDKYKVFHFEDSKGRPFSVAVFSKHAKLFGVEELPFYTTGIVDMYQVSVFQYERDRIQKILDDTGLEWSELELFDEGTEQIDKIREARSGYSTHVNINISGPIEKEDLKVIAQAGVEIDQILEYEYDKDVKTKLRYDDQHLSHMRVEFRDKESKIYQSIEFAFSGSENDRWTEEYIYNRLLEKYELYEKELELREEIPKLVVTYLEEKYNRKFIHKEGTGLTGNEMEADKVVEWWWTGILYEKDDTEKRFPISVSVHVPPSGDGEFRYSDDYERILEYKAAAGID